MLRPPGPERGPDRIQGRSPPWNRPLPSRWRPAGVPFQLPRRDVTYCHVTPGAACRDVIRLRVQWCVPGSGSGRGFGYGVRVRRRSRYLAGAATARRRRGHPRPPRALPCRRGRSRRTRRVAVRAGRPAASRHGLPGGRARRPAPPRPLSRAGRAGHGRRAGRHRPAGPGVRGALGPRADSEACRARDCSVLPPRLRSPPGDLRLTGSREGRRIWV